MPGLEQILRQGANQPFTQASPVSVLNNVYQQMLGLSLEQREEVVEKALEQVIEAPQPVVLETEEEVVVVEPIVLEQGPDIESLVGELKVMFLEGFEMFARSGQQADVRGLMLEEIKTLREIKETPPPNVEVFTPTVAPIKRFKTTNIVRDHNGDISEADFEVER